MNQARTINIEALIPIDKQCLHRGSKQTRIRWRTELARRLSVLLEDLLCAIDQHRSLRTSDTTSPETEILQSHPPGITF